MLHPALVALLACLALAACGADGAPSAQTGVAVTGTASAGVTGKAY